MLAAPKAPKGLSAGVRWSGDRMEATTVPLSDPEPGEVELLEAAGLDAARWAVDEDTVRASVWQQQVDGYLTWLRAFRFEPVRRDSGRAVKRDELEAQAVALLDGWVPETVPPEWVSGGGDAFAVFLSDWQLGKDEGDGLTGDAPGTVGAVARVRRMIDKVHARILGLRESGRPCERLYVFLLGDLVEGCDGFYAQQSFRADRDRRSQVRLVRRLLIDALKVWAPLFGETVVAVVAGNHGENRKDGKSFTTFADNDDVAVVEQVADVFELGGHPLADRIRWAIPEDRLHLTIDVAGIPLGIAHGHQLTGGGKKHSGTKARDYWAEQAFGLDALADARLFVTAHFHHFTTTQYAAEKDGPGRWHFQTPAEDGGSAWWRELSGQSASSATLTMRVGSGLPLGWADLELIA